MGQAEATPIGRIFKVTHKGAELGGKVWCRTMSFVSRYGLSSLFLRSYAVMQRATIQQRGNVIGQGRRSIRDRRMRPQSLGWGRHRLYDAPHPHAPESAYLSIKDCWSGTFYGTIVQRTVNEPRTGHAVYTATKRYDNLSSPHFSPKQHANWRLGRRNDANRSTDFIYVTMICQWQTVNKTIYSSRD